MHASHSRRCAALTAAITSNIFSEDSPTAMLMDIDQIDATIRHIQHEAGYPASTLHTVAVKANPVGKVLEVFRDRGMGAEAASLGELKQALHVGFEPGRIVFDSPAKTASELRFALTAGVAVNLDNFQELERAAALIASEPGLAAAESSGQLIIGLRINPQVGEGAISALSTGGAVSKFGFPLQEARNELLQAFTTYPWLNMLHLHVGSQGMDLQVVVAGIVAVWGLLKDIEDQCGAGRIKVLDIGGGLSVNFASDDPPQETQFQAQARLLAAHLPQLFAPDCHVRLMTENGRSLLAKAGCVASRVEYTKWSGSRHIAVTHVGADLCMRACYLPDTWGLNVFVCDSSGKAKEGAAGVEEVVQDVAGPLCFQGDRLAVGRMMPKAEVGDYIMVADVGAYALSMYSRYNSRCSPPVYGFKADDQQQHMQLQLLRAGETLEQVLQFWNQL